MFVCVVQDKTLGFNEKQISNLKTINSNAMDTLKKAVCY